MHSFIVISIITTSIRSRITALHARNSTAAARLRCLRLRTLGPRGSLGLRLTTRARAGADSLLKAMQGCKFIANFAQFKSLVRMPPRATSPHMVHQLRGVCCTSTRTLHLHAPHTQRPRGFCQRFLLIDPSNIHFSGFTWGPWGVHTSPKMFF